MSEYRLALEKLRYANTLATYPVASIHGYVEKQINELQKLVDKAESVKPIKFEATYDGVKISKCECPICENLLTPEYDYCSNCGQRIDWGENNEK